MSEEVSKLLRADLVRLGLTQEEFANKLGVTQQAVSAWYARNTVPHRRLKAIESVLGPDSELVAYMRDSPPPVLLRATENRRIREIEPQPVRVEMETRRPAYLQSNIVTRIQEERRQFRNRIESELPAGRVDVLVQTGKMERQFDYISDSLCIELLLSPPATGTHLVNYAPRVYSALVRLMLCRKVTAEDFPDRNFGIIFVADDSKLSRSQYLSRLQWECEEFDVSLSVVPRIEAAAELIIQIENSLGKDYESEL